MLCQSTVPFASKTREWNSPDGAYGVRRIQSITTLPPNTLKSLAAIGRIGPATASVCVATTAPSIEYLTLASVQSIAYRCGTPRKPFPRSVSRLSVPVLVRAVSMPPDDVLKIAHGGADPEKSCANPECWNASPVNVAVNSS